MGYKWDITGISLVYMELNGRVYKTSLGLSLVDVNIVRCKKKSKRERAKNGFFRLDETLLRYI